MKFVYFGMLIIGTIILFLSIKNFYDTIQFIKTAKKSKGTVIKIEKNSDDSLVKPVFKFLTENNLEIELRQSSSGIYSIYKVGDEVTIVYDENNYSNAMVLTFFDVFVKVIFFIIIGLTFSLIAILYFSTFNLLESLKI